MQPTDAELKWQQLQEELKKPYIDEDDLNFFIKIKENGYTLNLSELCGDDKIINTLKALFQCVRTYKENSDNESV